MTDYLQEKAMSNFLRSSAENDAYEERDRHFYSAHIGFKDEPVCDFGGKRGASDKEIAENLKMHRDICGDFKHNDFWGEPNEASLAYDSKLKRFAKTPESELYVVFHDDCKNIDPPIKLNKARKDEPEYWGEYSSEWNVFANWHLGHKEFIEVWQRRMTPYAEAVERIKIMQPIPLREKKLFKADYQYKEKIDELLPKLVHIEDENTAPYKVVVEQKTIKEELRQLFAILAAEKYRELLGGFKPPYVSVGYDFNLNIQYCQYDNHETWVKHCTKKGEQYLWDVSNDPDFAQSEQKIYQIVLTYYDAHMGGW